MTCVLVLAQDGSRDLALADLGPRDARLELVDLQAVDVGLLDELHVDGLPSVPSHHL